MSVRRRASGRAHYNYFRDYDPAKGGYTQSDPIGMSGGIGTYSYALEDPVLTSDELGLAPGEIFPTEDAAAKDLDSYSEAIQDNSQNAIYHSKDVGFLQRIKNSFLYDAGVPQVIRIDDCAWTWDIVPIYMGFPPDLGRKPGGLGKFKGRDALRRENKVARDAGTAARLDRAQRRELHDRISGQNLTYQQIVQVARDIAEGK